MKSVVWELCDIAKAEGYNDLKTWARSRYNETKSCVALAKRYGYCPDTFRKYLKMAGVKIKRGGARPHPKKFLDKEKILKLINQGGSIRERAKGCGVHRDTIRRRLKEWREER